MKLPELERAVEAHVGTFLCERIHSPQETKIVHFRHDSSPPLLDMKVPAIPGLADFYDTFGSILFYFDEKSGDAAKLIASPDQWAELLGNFTDWIDDLGDEERAEILPDWIDSALAIGEEPHTGNYILIPSVGHSVGRVFLFDHDGFEFTEKAANLVAYVEKLLDPDNQLLTEIATHMRFIDDDSMVQWWIRELRDNRGNVARTRE